MRITVDIEEASLRDLMKLTGHKNKSPSVVRAVGELVRLKADSQGSRV